MLLPSAAVLRSPAGLLLVVGDRASQSIPLASRSSHRLRSLLVLLSACWLRIRVEGGRVGGRSLLRPAWWSRVCRSPRPQHARTPRAATGTSTTGGERAHNEHNTDGRERLALCSETSATVAIRRPLLLVHCGEQGRQEMTEAHGFQTQAQIELNLRSADKCSCCGDRRRCTIKPLSRCHALDHGAVLAGKRGRTIFLIIIRLVDISTQKRSIVHRPYYCFVVPQQC